MATMAVESSQFSLVRVSHISTTCHESTRANGSESVGSDGKVRDTELAGLNPPQAAGIGTTRSESRQFEEAQLDKESSLTFIA